METPKKLLMIVNPRAGRSKPRGPLFDAAAAFCGCGYLLSIRCTAAPGDAARIAAAEGGQYDTVVAVGGDGTLNEVANGAVGFPFAEIAVIPVGTGNDFCKNFSNTEAFSDIGAQIRGKSIEIDALMYNGRVCVNVMNMGFDCSVVEAVAKIKRYSWISSGFAYIAGVIHELIRMPSVKISKMLIDGEPVDGEKFLLCMMANGGFYGGGFHSAPLAYIDDATIDLCLVKPLSRLSFISLVGGYQKGTFLEDKRTMKKIFYHKCRRVDINFESSQSVCFDGEIKSCTELHVEVVPKLLRFSVPLGSAYNSFNEEKKEQDTAAFI